MPYVGEIRMFAGNFEPNGWYFCDGRHLPISSHDTLFQLIGTRYGGDGEETFALPNLQSRVPIHFTSGTNEYVMGQEGGVEQVTLTINQLPNHTHPVIATSNPGSQSGPGSNVYARNTGTDCYSGDTPTSNMAATTVQPVGGSQPHDNMQPFLVINYIISLYGVFPSAT